MILIFLSPAETSWRNSFAPQSWRRNGSWRPRRTRRSSRTQELIEALEAGPDFLDAFDGELFRELVDKIIVESNDRLRFRLANGLELTEPIERTVR